MKNICPRSLIFGFKVKFWDNIAYCKNKIFCTKLNLVILSKCLLYLEEKDLV